MTDYAKIFEECTQAPAPAGAVLRCIADIPAQKLSWLWPGRIPLGKLTLFSGDPGLGKSLVTLDIAARVTCKTQWPDGAENEKSGSVIILSSEDDVADTIRPRLEAANADITRIHILEMVRRQNRDGGGTSLESFNLKDDIIALQDAVAKLGDVRLIIIDPASAYLGDTDSHVNAKVRGLLRPLAQLAQDLRVAILLIDHLNKSNLRAMYRSSGSIAFTANARATWCFGQDPDDPENRLMLPVKFNLGPTPKGISYRIQQFSPDVPVVAWGGVVDVTADDILRSENTEERSERLEATEWLQDRLAGGAVATKELQADAREAGLSWATLRRAKDALGVISEHDDAFKGGWSWRLPSKMLTKAPQDAQHIYVSTLGAENHLNHAVSATSSKMLTKLISVSTLGSEHLGNPGVMCLTPMVLAVPARAVAPTTGVWLAGERMRRDAMASSE